MSTECDERNYYGLVVSIYGNEESVFFVTPA